MLQMPSRDIDVYGVESAQNLFNPSLYSVNTLEVLTHGLSVPVHILNGFANLRTILNT